MRFFIELAYKGTHFAGFQIQENAVTVQSELERALQVFYRQNISLTGSSRTDSGVHALQNYFHFDADLTITPRHIYNINAILHPDIVVKRIFEVHPEKHCRFHAQYRAYEYHICQQKEPFLQQISWFYPYKLDLVKLNEGAALLMNYQDFTSFSKRNTQTHTKLCTLTQSEWEIPEPGRLVYKVQANRFLRGMVRGLVATTLQLGKGKITIEKMQSIIEAKDCSMADFSAPAHGLFLKKVFYNDPEIDG